MFYDEEGDLDVSKVAGSILALIAVIGIAAVIFYTPETKDRSAGTLTSLQLHETTFSRLTTVETSEGWYQVQGAVSASKGDPVTIKTSSYARDLCIESHDGTSCFTVR
jgi:hypothetical protein